MKILIDSREQRPFEFASFDVAPETATLPCGDYSLPGFVDRVAVERKSLDDLVGCLVGKNRDRFERELARDGHYKLFSVVVEGSLADLALPAFQVSPSRRPWGRWRQVEKGLIDREDLEVQTG